MTAAAMVFSTFFAFLITSPAVFAADSLVWSAKDGSCILGEGGNAVAVTAGDGAVSFAGSRPSLVYLGKFLPEEKTGKWQTVLQNVSLDDVEVYSTKYYNPTVHPGLEVAQTITGVAFPFDVSRAADGSVSMVFLLFDSVYTKGVKVTLRQEGQDIVGRVDWAKYAKGDFVGADNDFTDSKWSPMRVASEEVATNSYGIDQLTFRPKNSAALTRVRVMSLPEGALNVSVSGGVELIFDEAALAARGGEVPTVAVVDSALTVEAGETPVSVPGTISGSASDVSFAAAASLSGKPDLRLETNMVFTTAFEDCVFRNVRLCDVTNAVAWMSGSNLSPSHGYNVEGFFFENNGKTASCQFQYKGGDFIKCVLLEMEQSGADVRVKTPHARYLNFTEERFAAYSEIGLYKFTSSNGSGWATVTDGPGYCITNLLLNGTAPSAYVKLSGNCPADAELRFSFNGGDDNRLVAEMVSQRPLSQSEAVHIDVCTNASLVLNINSAVTSTYRVYPGGTLENWANWSVNPKQEIYLDGGTANFGVGGTDTYARKVVFRDGAKATGDELLFGNGDNGFITVAGDKPSVAETGFGFYCNVPRTFTFFIDDVTGTSEPDFTVRGKIYHNFSNYTTSSIIKSGPGTMRWEAACTAVGEPIEIREGTLSLGGTDIIQSGHGLVFSGGAIAVDAGAANACGVLSLQKNASFELGAGSSLSFASLGDWTDGATLDVTAGKGAQLRIGTGACLSAVQLRGIRINGLRVDQQDDGSVVARPRPSFMIIR